MHDGADGVHDVCRVVDDGRVVARADAQSRRAGGVGSIDHARATGCEDDVSFLHERVRELDGRHADPVDDALRASCGLCSIADDACSLGRALLCTGVRRDQDGIARLQADQGLEDGRGRRVRRRDDSSDDAERLCDLRHSERRIALDDAAGLRVLVLVVDELGGVVVLDDLVLHDAVAGLIVGQLRQRNARLVGSESGSLEDLVDLLLAERREFSLGGTHRLQMCLQRLYTVDDAFL